MNSIPEDPTTEDPRLLRAVQEYLAEIEGGRRPDRRAFAARFPDLSAAMAPYLEALDAVHGTTPSRASSSVQAVPVDEAPDTAEPLGDFRIVKEIGRGGMGVVYEAIQLSLGRSVALKVLPFAAALDARQLQRFKNEAQAAANLHHTNIVPVYFVGCERGVHFYAMQLIEGDNLAAVIKALRRDAPPSIGEGRRRERDSTGPYQPSSAPPEKPAPDTRPILGTQLSTQRSARTGDFFRTVARLVAQAAEGLDYAHGLGIVHRDIKPANILVDTRGNVWVTDFGLAQFHANPGLTQTGDLVGTLRYMSPEQAGGQRVLLDHRVDVYSLGATLYEMLTLRPIFEGQDRQALLRQILNEEPRPPRAIDRAMPPELETIVLKAVAKVPAERYATAREFADDLQRFLRDEPIKARRATLTQRGRKWLRRHPSVLVAGSVLLVLLAAGSLVAAGFIRSAYERERQRAEEAEEQFRLARQAADDMIQLAEEELADKPHMEGFRMRLLERALAYYTKFIEQRRDDPAARADLDATQARVEKILADLTLLQGANQLSLLKEKSVLDDLRPSIDQRERIDELSRRLEQRQREQFGDFFRLTQKEKQQRFLDLARANEEDVAAILTPEQRDRLRQIELQLKGPGAFRETKVATALRLLPAQKERIEAIEAEMFFGMMGFGRVGFGRSPPGGPFLERHDGPGPGPPGDRRPGPPGGPHSEEWQKGLAEKREAALGRIERELTEKQKQDWRKMTGEPFKGSISFGLPPGGFGPAGPKGPR